MGDGRLQSACDAKRWLDARAGVSSAAAVSTCLVRSCAV